MKHFLFVLLMVAFVSGKAQPQRVDVIENASRLVTPDLINLNFRVSATEKQEAQAVQSLDALLKQRLNELQSAGFEKEEIKLAEFYIATLEDHTNEKRKITGYKASQAVTIKIPVSRKALIGRVVSMLADSKEGETTLYVSTKLSTELDNKISEELVAEAILKARRKAEVIATTLGITLALIEEAEYGGHDFDRESRFDTKFPYPWAASTSDISAWENFAMKDVEKTERVRVVWQVEQQKK